MITASLNEYRQSPRKVRLVANLVKGKQVNQALNILTYTVKEASLPLAKLIRSALANAKNTMSVDEKDLYVTDIQVNAGVVLKRSMPRARGSAFPIKKRSSHISLILNTKSNTK